MSNHYVVSYDIQDDKIRRQVHQALKNRGKRIQYSVFECHFAAGELQELIMVVKELIEPGDSVRWYPLCKWCSVRTSWQGRGETVQDQDYFEV
jgi:CRISPR-associated protein Cas2